MFLTDIILIKPGQHYSVTTRQVCRNISLRSFIDFEVFASVFLEDLEECFYGSE